MKYLAPALFLAALVAWALSYFNPGSGWGIAAISAFVIGAIVAGISKANTGKWFTNDSGGH